MGAIALLAPLAWRNLWRNPRRTLITLAVVAVGVWSILAFDVMLQAWAASAREESLRLLTGDGQIHAAGYLDDPGVDHAMAAPSGALLQVLDGAKVGAWAPRVRVSAILRSEYRTRAVTLLGVAPAAERKVSDLPGEILAGRYLNADDEIGIVIGQDLADRLKTRLGKRVIVMTQAADGHLAELGLPIVGLFGNTRPVQDEYVFIGLGTARQALGLGDRISEVSFDAAPPTALDAVVGALRQEAPDLDVQSWMTLSPLVYTMDTYSRFYTGVWLMVMVVLMAIGIVNTQLMAVFERLREFGLLQALGMRPGLVLAQVMLESALLIGLGVGLGVAVMLVTLLPMSDGVSLGFLAAGSEMAGGGSVLHPRFDPRDAALFSLIVWLLGIAATLWPARKAAKTNPVEAMGAA